METLEEVLKMDVFPLGRFLIAPENQTMGTCKSSKGSGRIRVFPRVVPDDFSVETVFINAEPLAADKDGYPEGALVEEGEDVLQ